MEQRGRCDIKRSFCSIVGVCLCVVSYMCSKAMDRARVKLYEDADSEAATSQEIEHGFMTLHVVTASRPLGFG